MLMLFSTMSASQFRRRFVAGVIFCGLLSFLIGRFTGFESRWRRLTDGCTESDVRQVLGPPNWIGTSGYIGAGGKDVIRWEYRRSELGCYMHYYVDFDYIGAGSAPVVYRSERVGEDWELPSWFPWARAKVKA
jgi:hypothetical protein